MPEFKALARDCRLRGYSRLRKADLIAFLQEPELEAPLILAKKFKNLVVEIDNLKSQMEELEDKVTKASESTNARFKKKKIRSMKCKVGKIAEKLRECEGSLKSLEPRVPKDPISGAPFERHPPNRYKHIEVKMAELNKKIKRAKNRRNKDRLIAN